MRWTESALLFLVAALCGCATGSLQPSLPGGCAARSADHSISLGTGADPSIVFVDGAYYYVQSTSDGRSIVIRQAGSLASLADQLPQVLWQGGRDGTPCCELWAPELEYLRGKWYVYFAADDGHNASHRLYAIEADRPDGPYSLKGRIDTPGEHWSIDGTAFVTPSSELYFLWSGWAGEVDGQQNIYIARMQDPWTIVGPSTLISAPEFAWEMSGAPPRVTRHRLFWFETGASS